MLFRSFFILVLLVLLAFLGAFVLQNRSVEGPLVPAERPVPISVETVNVSLQPAFKAEEKFTGIVSPRRTSQLGFASGGRINDLRVDIGDRVETGQVLAVLDTRSLRAQLSSANAVVAEAARGDRRAHVLEVVVDQMLGGCFAGFVARQRGKVSAFHAQLVLEQPLAERRDDGVGLNLGGDEQLHQPGGVHGPTGSGDADDDTLWGGFRHN